jgi:hypothetical protein
MASRNRCIRAELTFVALFALVSLCMNFVAVAIVKNLIAALALDGNVGCVKLLDVYSQICLPATSRRTQFALKDGLIAN